MSNQRIVVVIAKIALIVFAVVIALIWTGNVKI